MFTEQELQINNKSYTNKDFNTIYPELLDLATKLTNKWDPTTSNESDPGVVLLKLGALLADKNNYNIDKNVLETFPLSVTQRANAWKLYDMLGYPMHYYRSAVTDLTFYYTGTALNKEDDTGVGLITIPRWTMVTDDSGETVFTITDDVVFSEKNTPATAINAIQGTIVDYEVNGVTTITLDNLDSEYRLFFTETMIAENGIFISNIGVGGKSGTSDLWTRVDNLESATLNQTIYKFGILPNTGTCYVQFPLDIGTLIKNGLSIKYIVTSGEAGNVLANILTTLYTDIIPEEFTVLAPDSAFYNAIINQDVIIKNTYATSNGKDPEDLDEAYRNYKKTVGTFNTLVTTEDYENAIYNLNDGLGRADASNSVVSDRTSDLIRSTQVVLLTAAGKQTIVLPETETIELTGTLKGTNEPATINYELDKIDYFDIGLYVLNPMEDVYNLYFYDRSFSVIDSALDIEKGLMKNKVVSHNFLNTSAEYEMWPLLYALTSGTTSMSSTEVPAPYIFKNFYTLNGKVMTYYKVTEKQAEEIEENIIKALYKKFNARNVEFGLAINYDDIVKTIENADTRIKTLILNEPEYELRYMLANDKIGSYKTSVPLVARSGTNSDNYKQANMLIKLLAKMIVGGHVLLYKWNKDINFDFGLTNILKYSNVAAVTTENIIDVKNSSTGILPTTDADGNQVHSGYTVQDNQNIILYAPNMYAKISYGAYVNYRWDDTINPVSGQQSDPFEGFKSGNFYQLKSTIYLEYTDSNGNSLKPQLGNGTIIRFVNSSNSGDILKMNSNLTIEKVDSNGETKKYCTLQASLSIEVMEVNAVNFSDTTQNSAFKGGKVQAIWFTNRVNKTNTEDAEGNEILEYTLFKPGEKLYLLQENEYFIYTNKDRDELVILGSGTLLCRNIAKNNTEWSHACSIPASSIIEKGLSVITDTAWYTIDGESTDFTIVELQLVTLGKNSGFRCESLIDGDTESIAALNFSNYVIRARDVSAGDSDNIFKVTPTTSAKVDLFTLNCKDAATAITNRIYFTVKESSGNFITDVNTLLITSNISGASLKFENNLFCLTGAKTNSSTMPAVTVALKKDKHTTSEYTIEIKKDVYKVGTSLSLVPMRVTNPEYCEDMTASTQSWIKLADYNIADDTSRLYSYNWSVISRYNVLVSPTYRLTLASESGIQESLTLHTRDTSGNLQAYNTPIDGQLSFLSNTLFSFAGGNNLEVSTGDDTDEINIYSFTAANLPTVDFEQVKRSSLNGQINLIYNVLYSDDWIVKDGDTKDSLIKDDDYFDLPFSFSTKEPDGSTDNTNSYTYMVPVYLSGGYTEVKLKVLTRTGTSYLQKDGVDIEVTLNSNNPVGYIKVENTNTFGGIRVVSWTKVSDDIEHLSISDTLKIGKVYVLWLTTTGSLPFSDLVTVTLENIAKNILSNPSYLADLNNALSSYFTHMYKDYDLTYEVPQEDLIDTDVGFKENKDNLFFSNVVWDKNHICNKFTIPQFNTSGSSIKVAATSILR